MLNVLIVNMLIKGGPAMETDERALRIRDAIDVLIHLMRLHHRIVERRIDGLGVHHSQHRMLMKVARLGRSASQKDIAEAMDVSPACVARTLKRLSAEGLVEKTGGADGRCNEIAILPAGHKSSRHRIIKAAGVIFLMAKAPIRFHSMDDIIPAGKWSNASPILLIIQTAPGFPALSGRSGSSPRA